MLHTTLDFTILYNTLDFTVSLALILSLSPVYFDVTIELGARGMCVCVHGRSFSVHVSVSGYPECI